jgi:hypothetical protein
MLRQTRSHDAKCCSHIRCTPIYAGNNGNRKIMCMKIQDIFYIFLPKTA